MEIIQFIIKIIISGFVVITIPMEGNDLITSIINGSIISEAAVIAVPMLVVALIIPLVIFAIGKNDVYNFDKNVILNHVILYKCLILFILIISLTLFFKRILFLSALLSLFLMGFAFFILMNSYRWLRSYDIKNNTLTFKQKKRIKYLKNIKEPIEVFEVWSIILSDEKLLEKNQIGFIDVLITTLKKIEIKNDSISKNLYSELLHLLSNSIEKVNFAYVGVYENLTNYLLSYYSSPNNRLNSRVKNILLFKLLKYGIKEDKIRVYDYLFFKEAEKFFKIQDNRTHLPDFYSDLLNHLVRIEDIDVKNLWENDFLRNNTITKEKLKNREVPNVTRQLLYKYVSFFQNQTEKDSHNEVKQYGSFLNQVTLEVFPTIKPVLWFYILLFYRQRGFGILSEDMIYNRIQGWYSKKEKIFFHPRITIGFGEHMDEQHNKEKSQQETIFILKHILSKELGDSENLEKISKTIQEIIKKEKLDENSEKRIYLEELDRYISLFH